MYADAHSPMPTLPVRFYSMEHHRTLRQCARNTLPVQGSAGLEACISASLGTGATIARACIHTHTRKTYGSNARRPLPTDVQLHMHPCRCHMSAWKPQLPPQGTHTPRAPKTCDKWRSDVAHHSGICVAKAAMRINHDYVNNGVAANHKPSHGLECQYTMYAHSMQLILHGTSAQTILAVKDLQSSRFCAVLA